MTSQRVADHLTLNNTTRRVHQATVDELLRLLTKKAGLRSQRFLGGVGVRFLTTLGVRVGFFCLTPDVQLDHFFNHTLKLVIPVEMVVSFEAFVETEISCCAPQFLLIFTAKYHSFMLRSQKFRKGRIGVGNLERSELELDIVPPTPQA